METVRLDGAGLRDRAEAMDLLDRALALPSWWGRNLDALHDCLTGLGRPVRLEVERREAMEETAFGRRLLRVLEDAAAETPGLELVFLPCAPSGGAEGRPVRLIDAHAHVVQCIAGTGSQGELRPCGGGRAAYATGQSFQILPPEFGAFDAPPEALLRVMDAHGVDKAVLLQGNYFGFQNLYTWEAVRAYPDRFAGAAAYDPFSAQADRIRTHLFDELGFRIVKFEVSSGSGLMANHPPVDLDGEVMHREYRCAADRDLIFVIDIGKPRSVSWQVDALARAIARYPSMRFVVCHLLSPQLGDGELLRRALGSLAMPNVWFDLAALCLNSSPETYPYPTARGYLLDAVKLVGADRLLWGSDMPSAMTRDSYRHFIDFVALHPGLGEAEKEQILCRNAEGLFFSK